uniref:Uncharacterized protein n=1 Tax=Tetranychus urticae TaxID=32264 RepID=T1KQD7_TETUR
MRVDSSNLRPRFIRPKKEVKTASYCSSLTLNC